MTDVRTILSEDDIKALVDGYSQDEMDEIVRESLIEPYRRSSVWVNYQLEEFFIPHATAEWQLSAGNRERVLLGVLCGGDPTDLAIHIYWAIAQGQIDVGEIAESLLLASTYKGISAWSSSISTLTTTLMTLQTQVANGQADSTDCINAIAAAFS